MSVTRVSLCFVIRNHFGVGMFIWHKGMLASDFCMAIHKDFLRKELG